MSSPDLSLLFLVHLGPGRLFPTTWWGHPPFLPLSGARRFPRQVGSLLFSVQNPPERRAARLSSFFVKGEDRQSLLCRCILRVIVVVSILLPFCSYSYCHLPSFLCREGDFFCGQSQGKTAFFSSSEKRIPSPHHLPERHCQPLLGGQDFLWNEAPCTKNVFRPLFLPD